MNQSTINKAYKAIVSIPAWQQQLLDGGDATDHIDSVQAAFAKVPIIYRAVKMRCDALSSVPVKISNLKTEKEAEWPFDTQLDKLIWNTEAALLGDGKAVILKVLNRVRTLDLQWLNPFTVTVQYIQNQGLTFHQGETGSWTEKDVIYIKEFSYANDVTAGVSTVGACLNDAALMNYQTRFASKFFESGAMPIILVSAEGIQDDEKARIQSFFTKLASGVQNAWRVLATRTKLTPEVVSQDLDKMTMPALYLQASKNIAAAFGIPANMFQGDDNFASADSHRMQFWQDVIRPRGQLIESAFNRQLLEPMNLKMEFAFDELDIFQEDEVQRATAFSIYVNAGMKQSLVAEMLGLDLPKGVEYAALDEKEPEPPKEIIVQPNPRVNPDFTDELAKWERKCIKRVKDGKPADCDFESDVIPEGVMSEIHAALKLCVNADEVRKIFDRDEEPMDTGLTAELKRANDLLERSMESM